MKLLKYILVLGMSVPGKFTSACSFILNPDFSPQTIYLRPIIKTTGIPGDVPAQYLYIKVSEFGDSAMCGPYSTYVNILWLLLSILVIFSITLFIIRKYSKKN